MKRQFCSHYMKIKNNKKGMFIWSFILLGVSSGIKNRYGY